MTTPREQIAQIDRKIDFVSAQLEHIEVVDPESAASWQAAWDRHPELESQFRALYRARGDMQVERDRLETPRRTRSKPAKLTKCPTCGTHTFQKAA